MTTDNRSKNLLQFTDPGRNGRMHAVGVWGGKRGDVYATVNSIISAAQKFVNAAADIHDNSNIGPHRRPEKLKELSMPTLAEMNRAAIRLSAQRQDVADSRASIKAAPDYSSSRPWEWAHDMEIAKHFASMPAGQQAAILHQLRTDAYMDTKTTYALLRTPRELSGLSLEDFQAIDLSMKSVIAGFKEVDEAIMQINIADKALHEATAALFERGEIHMGMVLTDAPELAAYTQASGFGNLAWYQKAAPVRTVYEAAPIEAEPQEVEVATA